MPRGNQGLLDNHEEEAKDLGADRIQIQPLLESNYSSPVEYKLNEFLPREDDREEGAAAAKPLEEIEMTLQTAKLPEDAQQKPDEVLESPED